MVDLMPIGVSISMVQQVYGEKIVYCNLEDGNTIPLQKTLILVTEHNYLVGKAYTVKPYRYQQSSLWK